MIPITSFLYWVVEAFESSFPEQVRSYYLLGSYAEGSAVPLLSEIDMIIIFQGKVATDQAEAAQRVAQACAARSPVRLDLMLRGESELEALHSVLQRSLKSGSRLLHGVDLRPALSEIPLESYRWAVWDGALHFSLSILRGVQRSELPLSYPALKQCRRYFQELRRTGNPATQVEAEMRLQRLTSSNPVY